MIRMLEAYVCDKAKARNTPRAAKWFLTHFSFYLAANILHEPLKVRISGDQSRSGSQQPLNLLIRQIEPGPQFGLSPRILSPDFATGITHSGVEWAEGFKSVTYGSFLERSVLIPRSAAFPESGSTIMTCGPM